jgi:ketosteroid isomerase-like protein
MLSCTAMDDQTAILTAITEYREAFNTGDVERLVAVFASGYTDMSFGVPSFYGEEAPVVLRRRMERLFAEYMAEMKISVIVVNVLGDMAYDCGWHILTLTPKLGGEPVKTRQRYICLWARQGDGSWKIRFYMDNPDMKPAMVDEEFGVPWLEGAVK